MGKWQRLGNSSDVAGPNRNRSRALHLRNQKLLHAESGRARRIGTFTLVLCCDPFVGLIDILRLHTSI